MWPLPRATAQRPGPLPVRHAIKLADENPRRLVDEAIEARRAAPVPAGGRERHLLGAADSQRRLQQGQHQRHRRRLGRRRRRRRRHRRRGDGWRRLSRRRRQGLGRCSRRRRGVGRAGGRRHGWRRPQQGQRDVGGRADACCTLCNAVAMIRLQPVSPETKQQKQPEGERDDPCDRSMAHLCRRRDDPVLCVSEQPVSHACLGARLLLLLLDVVAWLVANGSPSLTRRMVRESDVKLVVGGGNGRGRHRCSVRRVQCGVGTRRCRRRSEARTLL